MSRTWNTAPYWVRKRMGLSENRAWWASTRDREMRNWSTLLNRRARHDARARLKRGEEPEPYRPHGSAAWFRH